MATFKRRELPLWRQLQDRCEHFNGLINDTCRAGVAYVDIRDDSQTPYAFPCLKEKTYPSGAVASNAAASGSPSRCA